MTVYICAALLAIVFSSVSKIKIEDNVFKLNGIAILVSFLSLWIISGLRYDVGQDYFFTYVPIFNSVKNTGTYPNVEKGYILLNKITLFFTKDYVGIFLITSFIFCFFIYLAIYQQSKKPWLSIFIFITSTLYFISMNLVRQSITIAIFFYSIKYIVDRNFKKYLFFILIASSIHQTALIFIPVYFIVNFKISFKRFLILYVGLEVLVPLFKGVIYNFISTTKYAYYIGSIYDNSETTIVAPLISLVIVLIGYYYLNKDTNIQDRYYRVYLNIQILATLISTALGVFPLSLRIFVDFEYIQLLFIPSIVSREKNKFYKTSLLIGIILCYSFYCYYTIGILGGSKNIPYRTIFGR